MQEEFKTLAARIEEINAKLNNDMNIRIDELELHMKKEDAKTEKKLVEMDRKVATTKKEFE